MNAPAFPHKILISNKKALFDYEILEEFFAGIVLLGSEVKSLREKNAQLKNSYIFIHNGIPIIRGLFISEYKQNTHQIIDPKRERVLLLKKKEIFHLAQKTKEMGATLIAQEIVLEGNLIKVRIALARGRKKWQKKQVLKERDLSRETKKYYG